MIKNTNYPEFEEHKSFRLTNEQRPYFGLNLIDKQWDEVEIKVGTTAFYDGDVIRKIITWQNYGQYEYKEFDTELITRDRVFVLPKTAKGKEKKITPSNLLSVPPTGCCIYIALQVSNFESHVYAYSPKNHIDLPIADAEGLKSIADIKEWLDNYIKTCPDNYFDKVKKMRTMPHRTIKYNVGDIFRFEIDRENYGYGLIIGKIRELIKQGLFPKGHPMHNAMMIPLLIRLYVIKTKDSNLSVDEISKNKLLPVDLMCDSEIIWGSHDIIGHKTLCQDDIDFPMQMICLFNEKNIKTLYFGWGTGLKTTENVKDLPDVIKEGYFRNDGVAFSLPTYILKRVLQGQSEYNKHVDLLHPENTKLKSMIFEMLDLPPNIDMDTFNKECKGMTRNDYVELINRAPLRNNK